MDCDSLPEGILCLKLSPKARTVADAVLQAIKNSPVVVKRFIQKTANVRDQDANGEVSSKSIPLHEHYKAVQQFPSTAAAKGGKAALYMHNKSLIEVLGDGLTHQLYAAVQYLSHDVLVNYKQLYVSDFPKSSSDVLVGSRDSWSPLHQDLPLFCTSVILVLEGHKEFAIVPEEVVPSLRINFTPDGWDKPVLHRGKSYPNLQCLLQATGGALLSLRGGDLMVMPPRVFHMARNCAPTVSCNFSVCTMSNVPLVLSQTLTRIEQSPQDVMHFDSDFSRLLEDCSQALIRQAAVNPGSIQAAASRGCLPPVQSVLDKGMQLMEWYLTLQCIPKGWVQDFWGKPRDRLLAQLLAALPLHNRSGPLGPPVATAAEAAAPLALRDGSAGQQRCRGGAKCSATLDGMVSGPGPVSSGAKPPLTETEQQKQQLKQRKKQREDEGDGNTSVARESAPGKKAKT